MEPAKKKKSIDQAQALLAARARLRARTLPRAVLLVGTARGRDRVTWDAGQASWLLGALRDRVRADGQYVWTSYEPDDEAFDLDELCADLTSPSLFGETRFVCLADGTPLLETTTRRRGGSEAAKPFERALLHWAATPALGHRLYLALPNASSESTLVAALQEKLGEGLLFLPLRGLYDTPPPWNPDPLQTELVRFLSEAARERKLQLGPNSRLDLAQRLGSDLGRLESELEKLASSADAQGRVPENEVRANVAGGALEGEAFELADRIVRGDSRAALRWLREVERRGARRDAPGKRSGAMQDLGDLSGFIVAALVREGRRMLAAAEMREQGLSFETIAEALSVPDISVAREAFRARLFARDLAGMRELLAGIRELELDLKRRSVDAPLALERLLLRVRVRSAKGRSA
ncbi:MAG: hypothetical protein JNM84_16305 [Planctomycetes bacterium]|nr:hypothetical protein [Planctomycetota bacterium]